MQHSKSSQSRDAKLIRGRSAQTLSTCQAGATAAAAAAAPWLRQRRRTSGTSPCAISSTSGTNTSAPQLQSLQLQHAGSAAKLHTAGPSSSGGSSAAGTPVAPSSGSTSLWPYPYIDERFPGLERVHEEPPVFVVHDFLSEQDCQLLQRSAEARQLPDLQYDNAVLIDTHRLAPLLLVVAAGAGFDCWHALSDEGLVSGALTPAAVAAAACPALLRWAAGIGVLLAGALAAANWLVGGKVFTGTKWTAAGLDPAHPAAPAFAHFLARTCALLGTPVDRLEPPTVTRYHRGQYQRVHFDARPDGDPAGLQKFLEAGGQRLVQIVVYLNSLAPEQGGGTRFYHPLLGGLTVQPQRGDALVFFPAYADGRFDERMAHAGLAVESGEKWIINTWACQRSVPAAVTQLHLPVVEPAAAAPGSRQAH